MVVVRTSPVENISRIEWQIKRLVNEAWRKLDCMKERGQMGASC